MALPSNKTLNIKKQMSQPNADDIIDIAAPNYSDYWQANIAVIPEYTRGFNWSCIYKEGWKPSEDQYLEWDLAASNSYALVTGEPSGIIALDLDHITDAQIARVKEMFGTSPCAKFGTKGLTIFFKYNGEANFNWVKDKVTKAELLSTGRRTTIPPSKHYKVKGVYYKWVGADLISSKDKLPTLPHNYITLLDSLFSITRPKDVEYIRADYDFPPSYEDAVDALNHCDPSCDNGTWVQIGMAFKGEVGDAGFEAFDSWSSRGSNYDAKSMRSRWRSFNSRNISYGTLVYYAKQGGYKVPQRAPIQPTVSMSVKDWTSIKLEHYAAEIKKAETLPDFYINAPHHIKTICDWIVSTSRYPQPLVTMGAVLSFLGFYMGSEFSYKGIKGNIYNINLARTGHGKEHILACLRGLMGAGDMKKYIGGSGATSDTAILEKLQETDGKSCYMIDEFQSFMKVLSNKKSGNSREAGLTSVLLKAYTSRSISGVDYADRKERKTVEVENPFLSLVAFCTPEPFYEAVGSAEAFNGFVGRLTIFEAPKILPQRNRGHQPDADLHVPDEIVRILRDIKANRKMVNHADGAYSYAKKTEIPETPEAHALIENINDEIDDKRREYDQEDSQMSNVIARVFEVMKKYSLIASKGKEISVANITWAKAVADYNVGIMLGAAENITDSGFERKKSHVFEFILKRGGVISKSDLTRYCTIFENPLERTNVVNDLLEGGRIELVKMDSEGTKPRMGYRILTK